MREQIFTARLLMRPPCLEDAERIFHEYAQDPLVTRFLTWSPHAEISQTKTFIGESIRAWRDKLRFPWVIETRDGQLLGMIELRPERGRAEAGYVLARRYWGQGYATEALRAVIEAAWQESGIYRIWAVCDCENAASARVLEKAGLEREALLRKYAMHPTLGDQPRDAFCYAIVRSSGGTPQHKS